MNLIEDMKNTIQFEDINVYQHGVMVHEYFNDLYSYLKYGTALKYEWRLPEWLDNDLLKYIDPYLEEIKQYHILHDCGKPYCLEIRNGKRHFPNHAEVSYHTYLQHFDNQLVADLIRNDMQIHLIKDKDIQGFMEFHPIILLLTGLSEIHANATMFGGIDSTSFKIKYKQINKRGKKICQLI